MPTAAPGLEVLQAGTRLGPYGLERELGRGGMGQVWLAHRVDGQYESRVAIKVLHSTGLELPGAAQRFAREGRILARLTHPNIAQLLDVCETDSGHSSYMVMEYIDGEPIDRHCRLRGLNVGARLRLFIDVLGAVAHAHDRLILHRDIKPGNVMVRRDGVVKLLDFGVAKLTEAAFQPASASELTLWAGAPFTPDFAAPEQLQGAEVSTATDVYSLGVLLFLLLTGTHPTLAADRSPLARMRAVLEAPPRRLSQANAVSGRSRPWWHPVAAQARELRGDLEVIVAHALEKAPNQRYANAQQFADDLRRYLMHKPIAARRDAKVYAAAKFVRRHRTASAAAAAVSVALGMGSAVAWLQAEEASRQNQHAAVLIEFMLGDLRKKLQPVGRLDVLDAIGEKTLAYYAEQRPERLDADALGRRSRALHLIGEIAEQRGDLTTAQRVFERAADTTAELLARSPRQAQRIFDHAQSVYWVGYVARRRGQGGAAEASLLRYLQMTRALLELDANHPEWRLENASAEMNLGVIRLELMRPREALDLLTNARHGWGVLVRTRPELHIELANTLGWIAKAQESLGDYRAAVQAQQEKMRMALRAPGAALNRRVQRVGANAHYELSRLHLALGQPSLAMQTAQVAVQRFEALVAQDPSNLDWLAQLTFAQLQFGEAQHAAGRHDEARVQAAVAAANGLRLTSADATHKKWHVTIAGSVLLLWAKLAPAAAQPRWQAELETYLATAADAEAAGQLDMDQMRIISAAELLLGDHLAASARHAQAQLRWQAAAERLNRRRADGDWPTNTLLAHAHLRRGDLVQARHLAQAIESSPYRHPAYADLRQRLERAAGAATVQ